MVILVTDGVANVGVTEQKKFLEMVEQQDVRLYTFIMGNGANRPLLNAITKRSDGMAMNISNSDDIVGAVMTAASKVTHEAMHDVDIKINGVKAELISPATIDGLYRGEQLIVFGHYRNGGAAGITLSAKISGQPVTYKTRFDFPKTSVTNPEIERLWALAKIEDLMEELHDFGEQANLKQAITDLALEYSFVTPFTSMVVAREEVFEAMGIERRNKARVATEKAAQKLRSAQAVSQRRVDNSAPMFTHNRAGHSGRAGVGNVGLIGLLLAFITWMRGQAGGLVQRLGLTITKRKENA